MREAGLRTGRREANCRQILARARKRIDQGRPLRFDRKRQRELAGRFLEAFENGKVDKLVSLLAADCRLLRRRWRQGTGAPASDLRS